MKRNRALVQFQGAHAQGLCLVKAGCFLPSNPGVFSSPQGKAAVKERKKTKRLFGIKLSFIYLPFSKGSPFWGYRY